MDLAELQKLTGLLEDNKIDIHQGSRKLCLTLHVLDYLNRMITQHIKEEKKDFVGSRNLVLPSGSSTPKKRTESRKKLKDENVQSFMQLYKSIIKTKHLKIIEDVVKIENTVSIEHFKDLTLLHVEKVNVNKLKGIKNLREHSQCVICIRSIDSIKSLLQNCGADNTLRTIWPDLRELVLSYNSLKSLDDSLECAPWLTSLDLSHNELENVDQVKILANLKSLNVSYNKLRKLPKLSGKICTRLQVLNASNNFVENLYEIQPLCNVINLDLSSNCLVDHNCLAYLSYVITLQWLNLKDNPLTYDPNHRDKSCSYLNSNVKRCKFILDYKLLTKSEFSLVGKYHPIFQRKLNDNSSQEVTLNESVSSSAIIFDKNRRVRNVEIEDVKNENIQDEDGHNEVVLSASVDHLEYKKHIETLRDIHGEDWLRLGYQFDSNVDQNLSKDEKTNGESSNEENRENLDKTPNKIITAVQVEPRKEQPEAEKERFHDVFDDFFNEEKGESSTDDDEEDCNAAGEEAIFLGTIVGEEDNVLVLLTDAVITERHWSTGRERAQWAFDTLVACAWKDEEHTTVQLDFDTLRKDRKQRIYVFEKDEAENFFAAVGKILANKSVRSNDKTYQCMKCLLEFRLPDHLPSHKEKNIVCPKCEGTIIIESDVK